MIVNPQNLSSQRLTVKENGDILLKHLRREGEVRVVKIRTKKGDAELQACCSMERLKGRQAVRWGDRYNGRKMERLKCRQKEFDMQAAG